MEVEEEPSEKSPPIISAPTPKLPEKRDDEIDGLLDLGTEDNPQELDLLNHPNYQEQNLAGNRRRRRRRVGEVEAPNKVTKIRLNGGNSRSEETEEDFSTPEEDVNDRYDRRISRRDTPPPEKVAVEMTNLEQDVYALMGISPLIRVDREVKDPRAVVLSINEPELSAETSGEDEEKSEEKVVIDRPIEKEAIEKEEIVEDTAEEVEEAIAESTDEVEESDTDNEDSDNRPLIRRRRRRRSSAQ
jgi:ribonuclease E